MDAIHGRIAMLTDGAVGRGRGVRDALWIARTCNKIIEGYTVSLDTINLPKYIKTRSVVRKYQPRIRLEERELGNAVGANTRAAAREAHDNPHEPPNRNATFMERTHHGYDRFYPINARS